MGYPVISAFDVDIILFKQITPIENTFSFTYPNIYNNPLD